MGALTMFALLVALEPNKSGIEGRIAERASALRAVVGVCARNIDTGETIEVGARERFPTASLIKLGVMVEAFHRVEAGSLALDRRVDILPEDRVGDGGIVDRLHPAASLTVHDLLSLMIRLSDNSATNALVRLVGTKSVDDRLASYGLKETLLFRPTFRDGRADVHPELEKEFGLGMTTPRDLAALMVLIAEGRGIRHESRDSMIGLLRGQEDRLMIPRGLPLEDPKILVANKTGWDEEKNPDSAGFRGDVRGDAAFVEAPGARYVLVVLMRRIADKRPTADNDAFVTGAAISKLVFEHFTKGGGSR